MSNFEVIDAGNGRFIKAWKKGVKFEEKAVEQLIQTAQVPFLFKYVAALPDCHWGCGSTVGTVLPTQGAVIPAAVGVDIGCGMLAVRTDLKREELVGRAIGKSTHADEWPLRTIREAIEAAVPCGRTCNGGPGDRGAWGNVPENVLRVWDEKFHVPYKNMLEKHPGMSAKNTYNQLGTLGTGNHFIELSEDENGDVWIVLHSGSRGLGNKIGQYFTNVAKTLCEKWFVKLPAPDLAYLPLGTPEFEDYCVAVTLAQEFAWHNRLIMLENIRTVVEASDFYPETVHCYHNYVAWENHFGQNIIVTRKGAVRARLGDMGIIPGSMGAKSFIVRGLGNPDSFCTCSHGAGRSMSRTAAIRQFSVADHVAATEGVECNKSSGVLDETPAAYKDINAVMAAQSDLVEIVHTLKQFVNVKGVSDGNRR